LSYNSCKIPLYWKRANIVPVYKKDNKNDVSNYRLIFLTSLVMKVYERIIRTKLFDLVIKKSTRDSMASYLRRVLKRS
jgi:hypothetical protein